MEIYTLYLREIKEIIMESIHIPFKVQECYGICNSNWTFSGSASSYFISRRRRKSISKVMLTRK